MKLHVGLFPIKSHRMHCKNYGIWVESLGNWGSKTLYFLNNYFKKPQKSMWEMLLKIKCKKN